MRPTAIVTVAAALSVLMMASATAQMRGLRDGPIPFVPLFGPRDEPPAQTIVRVPRDEPSPRAMMRGPRDDGAPGGALPGQRERQSPGLAMPGQREQSPAVQDRGQRSETQPVAQARTPRSEPTATAVALTQLNMDAVPSLTPDGVRKVQQLLKDKGLNPGPIDGVAGPLTNAAIKSFQDSYGIKANGGIDNQTLFALGAVDLAREAN